MPISGILAIAAVLIQSITVLVLRWRSTAGDAEYKETPVWKVLLIVAGISVLLTTIGCVLIFSAVGR